MKVTQEMIDAYMKAETRVGAGRAGAVADRLKAVLDLIEPPMPPLPNMPDWSARPRGVTLEIHSALQVDVLDMGAVKNPLELVAALRRCADDFEREIREEMS